MRESSSTSSHSRARRAWASIIMTNSRTQNELLDAAPGRPASAHFAQLLNYGESKVLMLIITGQLRSIKDGLSRRIFESGSRPYVQDSAPKLLDGHLVMQLVELMAVTGFDLPFTPQTWIRSLRLHHHSVRQATAQKQTRHRSHS